MVRFLNGTFPELQESTHLLLQPSNTLNALEKLQVKRVEHTLTENIPAPLLIRKKIKTSVFILTTVLLFTIILFLVPYQRTYSSPAINIAGPSINTGKPEKKLPEIKDVIVKIIPPSYTGRREREQDLFNIVAEQKAAIIWNITTTAIANQVQLIFNDKSVLSLKPFNKEHTQWIAVKTITQSGFYQVNIDKKQL